MIHDERTDERWDERAAGCEVTGQSELTGHRSECLTTIDEVRTGNSTAWRMISSPWLIKQKQIYWTFCLDLLGGTCHREQTWSGDSRRSPNPRSSRFCRPSQWRWVCCPGYTNTEDQRLRGSLKILIDCQGSRDATKPMRSGCQWHQV